MLNPLDILLVIPLAWYGIKGFRAGFIREITALLALVGGVYIAAQFSWFVGGYLERAVGSETRYISVASFAITFIGVIVLMHLTGRVATRMVKMAALGLPNCLAGALFGFLKTAFVLSVVLFIYSEFDPGMRLVPEKWQEKSVLYEPVSGMAPAVIPHARKQQESVRELLTPPEEP